MPYILEATYLAEQGEKIVDIDNALEKFGMPMGPFILADTVGIDVGIKVMHSLELAYGERMEISNFMKELEKNKDLLGKKTNKGFYIYGSNKSQSYNRQIDEIISRINLNNNFV